MVGGVCVAWVVKDDPNNDARITHESCTNSLGVATAYVSKATEGGIVIAAFLPGIDKAQCGNIYFVGYTLVGTYFVVESNINMPVNTDTPVSVTLMDKNHTPKQNAKINWASNDTNVSITTTTSPTITNAQGVATAKITVTTKADHKVTISLVDNSGNTIMQKTINIRGTDAP